MQKFDFPHATVTLKDGIIHVIFKEGSIVGAEGIGNVIKACQELSQGKPFYVLTDMRKFIEITPEGLKVAADRSLNPNIVANAVIVKMLGARLQASVFQEINQPRHPVEVFNDIPEALEWLKAQQEKTEKANTKLSE